MIKPARREAKRLLVMIVIFGTFSGVVHQILWPEPTLVLALLYALYTGVIFGGLMFLVEKMSKR